MSRQLDELLAPTRALGAQWSIAVVENGRPVVEHDPSLLLRTASVAKVFVLIELADRLVDGLLDGGLLIDRRASLPVRDSGVWHAMAVDLLPVVDVALLVGAHSDNWATNCLLDLLGLDAVRARAAILAPGGSTLHDYVRDSRSPEVPATLSEGCAADWVTIMSRLAEDDPASRLVLGWLAHDADLSMVASAFGLDPLAHDIEDLGLRLWHKTGTDVGVRADVGVVRSSGSVVTYAAICNWPADDIRASTRAAVLSAMHGIGDGVVRVLAQDQIARDLGAPLAEEQSSWLDAGFD